MDITEIFKAEEKAELFRLLYKLEDHFEKVNRNVSAERIGEIIRALNDIGVRG